jgi:hypothetical protein
MLQQQKGLQINSSHPIKHHIIVAYMIPHSWFTASYRLCLLTQSNEVNCIYAEIGVMFNLLSNRYWRGGGGSLRIKQLGHEADHSPPLVLMLGVHGVVPPLLHVSMAWCLINE